MFELITTRLQLQKQSGRWRQLQKTSKPSATSVLIDNKPLVNFSSNDYLSLSDDLSLRALSSQACNEYPLGAGGSTVVCAYDEEKARLSERFAEYLGAEKALFMSSGYMANLSVLTALLDERVDIFVDKHSHASVYDALAMKGLAFKRFHHNDMAHLEQLLSSSQKKHRFIVSEGLFSMTGQLAPLKQLVSLKKQYHAMLMIDDAHAIGVVGESGRGSISAHDFNDIDIITCSLNKAFCHSGAIIAAKNQVIEAIIQFARPYLYSSALSAAHAKSLNGMLEVVKDAEVKRQKLRHNISYFMAERERLNYQWLPSSSAISLLTLGSDEKAVALFEDLKQQGFYCYPMRSPTVSLKNTGLRVVLNSEHSKQQISDFCLALEASQHDLN